MDFQQAENRFRQLKSQFEAGSLSETNFKSQLEELMVQDEQGSWWMIGYETERWYRHDGTNWVQADPPGILAQEIPPRERVDLGAVETASRELAEREAAEKSANFTKPDAIKPVVAEKKLFQSWWGRSLLGGILGLILGFLYIGSAYYSSGAEVLIFVVACGLAGLITYPHKLSIIFLILGFFVAGFLFDPNLYNADEFIAAGGVFGIPAGALLSRILGWIKVLK